MQETTKTRAKESERERERERGRMDYANTKRNFLRHHFFTSTKLQVPPVAKCLMKVHSTPGHSFVRSTVDYEQTITSLEGQQK